MGIHNTRGSSSSHKPLNSIMIYNQTHFSGYTGKYDTKMYTRPSTTSHQILKHNNQNKVDYTFRCMSSESDVTQRRGWIFVHNFFFCLRSKYHRALGWRSQMILAKKLYLHWWWFQQAERPFRLYYRFKQDNPCSAWMPPMAIRDGM